MSAKKRLLVGLAGLAVGLAAIAGLVTVIIDVNVKDAEAQGVPYATSLRTRIVGSEVRLDWQPAAGVAAGARVEYDVQRLTYDGSGRLDVAVITGTRFIDHPGREWHCRQLEYIVRTRVDGEEAQYGISATAGLFNPTGATCAAPDEPVTGAPSDPEPTPGQPEAVLCFYLSGTEVRSVLARECSINEVLSQLGRASEAEEDAAAGAP